MKQFTSVSLIAILGLALSVCATGRATLPQAKNTPSIDRATIAAWQKRGAIHGWLVYDKSGCIDFVPGNEPQAGGVQGFRFMKAKNRTLPGLPAVAVPFGLDLTNTEVTDTGMKHLAKHKTLQTLHLADTAVTDAGLKHLNKLTNLQRLDLAANRISNTGLKSLGGLKKLQVLDLSNTDITNAGLKYLASFTKMQSLFLDNTAVSVGGVKCLAKFEKLRVLSLVGIRLTDAGLKHLARFKQLHSLDLRGTKVTDAGVKALRKALPRCKISTVPVELF